MSWLSTKTWVSYVSLFLFGDGFFTPSPYVTGIERCGNEFLWVDPIILFLFIPPSDLLLASVVASSYQLKEVLDGHRQSTDTASKRRVMEAMNAALRVPPIHQI